MLFIPLFFFSTAIGITVYEIVILLKQEDPLVSMQSRFYRQASTGESYDKVKNISARGLYVLPRGLLITSIGIIYLSMLFFLIAEPTCDNTDNQINLLDLKNTCLTF